MKREEEWLMMIAEKVVNLIEKEVSDDNLYEKTELISSIKDFFKEFQAKMEENEDEILSKEYGNRVDLPEEQWLKLPEGMSVGEFFYSMYPNGERKK